ncbi:hypothetical protein DFJ58DRAFT_822051, partial [Suillus subalutaceus]|uniref:uncharacterized protein n=1 Tax=Suillus subalutaceus TaxID=48586 RepID=UPI001B87893A
MRFSFVLVIVATLIASVSASDAATEHCPIFCTHDRHCSSGVVLVIRWGVQEVLNNVFASEAARAMEILEEWRSVVSSVATEQDHYVLCQRDVRRYQQLEN